MAFQDYVGQLEGQVPELPYLAAEEFVRQAWTDILKEKRRWSFQFVESWVTVPAQVNTGTVTVTQDVTTVTADASAKTALDAVGASALVGRVFRVTSTGPIYTISSYSIATGVITLDRAYYEASGSGKAYTVYQPYVTAPVLDFKLWVTFLNVIDNIPLSVNWTKQEIDELDPQRTYSNIPYRVAHHTDAADGFKRFELWPHPTDRRQFKVVYLRSGPPLSDTQDLPAIVPVTVLMARAKYRGYEWAQANRSRSEALKTTDWRFLMGAAQEEYQRHLPSVKIEDDNVYNLQWRPIWRHRTMIYDADYLQSHHPWGVP